MTGECLPADFKWQTENRKRHDEKGQTASACKLEDCGVAATNASESNDVISSDLS